MKSPDKNAVQLGTPHVTICVPAYNAARTIGRTLDSILAQDYGNYDVLVCDNLSSDDTARIVGSYKDKGIRYYLNPVKERYGESNWNQALAFAEGPLIALYHADDIYTPTMVSRQVEFLQRNQQACAVFTMSQTMDEQDRPIRMGSFRLPGELRGRECFEFPVLFNAVLKYHNIMMVPTLMTWRETLDRVGVFDSCRFCSAADIDLWLRMALWRPVGIIDEPLHRYRISPQQGSTQMNRYRTHLAHFYAVIDYYLGQPHIRALAQPDALAIYDMERGADQVFCAMNLLALGQISEARTRMKEALCLQYLLTAMRRPRRLARFLAGMGLMVSARLGLGTFVGRGLQRAYQWDLSRRQKQL